VGIVAAALFLMVDHLGISRTASTFVSFIAGFALRHR
jgi:hypothetical protein